MKTPYANQAKKKSMDGLYVVNVFKYFFLYPRINKIIIIIIIIIIIVVIIIISSSSSIIIIIINY